LDLQEVGPEEKAAQILYLAGVRLLSEGNGKNALQRLEKASEIYTKKGLKTDAAKCYKQMGNVYAFHEEWEKAETCYKKAIELEKESKNWTSFIENLFLMSNLLMDKNELEKAIKYTQEAEKISKKAKDEKSQFQAYKQMGIIYERKGDLKKAKESFQKAIKTAEKLKLPETETRIAIQEILWIKQKETETKNKKQ
jgi:tetratricopeptide (TPR) repeat protein